MSKKKRTKKKEVKAANFFVFFVFLGLFFGLIFSVLVYLKLKTSSFLSLNRVNFVFIDKEKNPFVFSFEEQNGLVLTLPVYNKFRVTRGFGEYELRKVYALGELEGKGGELLAETLQENIPVAIFGYFYDEKSKADFYLNSSRRLFFKIFFRGLKGELKTNLSKVDLIVLLVKSLRINSSLVKLVNYNGEAGDFFKDRKIREESLSIEVLNATEQSGLAQRMSRLFDKSGGRIVRIADAPEKQERCRIITGKDPRESYTLRWIRYIYDCPVEQIGNEEARADVTIVFGENYWKNEGKKW